MNELKLKLLKYKTILIFVFLIILDLISFSIFTHYRASINGLVDKAREREKEEAEVFASTSFLIVNMQET